MKEGTSKMGNKESRDYFKSLFQASKQRGQLDLLEGVESRVSRDMKVELVKEFNEVTHALNQMHPTKAHGPDGMTSYHLSKIMANYWKSCHCYYAICS